MDSQRGTYGDFCPAVHVFVEIQRNQAFICYSPVTNIYAIFQNKCTFAAINQQSIGNLILIGSRHKTVRTCKADGQFISGIRLHDIISFRILRKFLIVDIQQSIEVTTAVRLQILKQILNFP